MYDNYLEGKEKVEGKAIVKREEKIVVSQMLKDEAESYRRASKTFNEYLNSKDINHDKLAELRENYYSEKSNLKSAIRNAAMGKIVYYKLDGISDSIENTNVGDSVTVATTEQVSYELSKKEIDDAKELGIMCGLTEGLCLEHTPTGHIITILGWVDDKDITSHNGKPRIVKAIRDRQGHQWETNYSVDELMLMEYKTILEEIKP